MRVETAHRSPTVTLLVNRAVTIDTGRAFSEVAVAQPTIADVSALSPTSIYLVGKAPGTTTLSISDSDGHLLSTAEVQVLADLNDLRRRLREILPREPIRVNTAGGKIVLSGMVSGSERIAQAVDLAANYGTGVTNMMTVGGTQQVSLEVHIAEVSRTAAEALGISTAAKYTGNNAALRSLTGNNSPAIDQLVPTIAQAAGAFGTLGTVFKIGSNTLLGVTLDLLESKGYAHILASPTLVAISGSKASFLAGGEVPVPTVSQSGANVDFKPVGVSLGFVPTVLDDRRIGISISTEVSNVDPTVSSTIVTTDGTKVNIPGFATRRATTSLELVDGESFAIAGLFKDDFTDTVNQLPWIGNVPILGALFRSSQFQKGQTELVIMVTAHFVAPVGEQALALPTDTAVPPTHEQLFLKGQVDQGRVPPALTPVSPLPIFEGEHGYVLR